MSKTKDVKDITSPRLESDKEDAGETKDSKEQKLVKDSLGKVDTWDAKGVDVDKKMLEGRKANRGFTISMASKTADSGLGSQVRSEKRAQTLPAQISRRGEIALSTDVIQKLNSAQATLVARRRRGSVEYQGTIISTSVLKETWEKEVISHSHGLMTEGQAHGDEREREVIGKDIFKGDNPPIIACQKGSKGFRDTTPNQDNFSITVFKNGYSLACAFDGHGPFGHLVSTRTVQTVPYFLMRSEHFPIVEGEKCDIGAAMIEAFEKSHKDAVLLSLEDGWDIQASGSTAVACVWKGNKVWTANCGDSRVVIGTEVDKTLFYETVDHKPDSKGEKARIEEMGGEVRTQTYPDGWVNHRIFVKGEDYPGLCMARTLGDESVKAYGVIATPEIGTAEVDLSKDPFIILASDGVWEFLDSSFVVKAVAKKIKTDGPENTIRKLQREARKRWKQEEGDYCDDITSILLQLR